MRLKAGEALFQWLVVAALVVLGIGIITALLRDSDAQPFGGRDAPDLGAGQTLYATHCAACHGANLEGQPGWRERLPSGRMPAPPHDASGHTWHHPDPVLFGITKEGLVPGKYAPPKYQSDMPGFAAVLSDGQIRAVLAYIKSTWPEREREYQREVTRKYGSGR
jgi:mono/diheme cytochrome c family protein